MGLLDSLNLPTLGEQGRCVREERGTARRMDDKQLDAWRKAIAKRDGAFGFLRYQDRRYHMYCDAWREHETGRCDTCAESAPKTDRPEPPDPLADEGQSDARELARERWER